MSEKAKEYPICQFCNLPITGENWLYYDAHPLCVQTEMRRKVIIYNDIYAKFQKSSPNPQGD